MRRRKLGGFLLGLAALLILSGGMLAMAGVALGGRTSLYGSNTPTYEYESVTTDSYTGTAAFQRIEVDISLGDVYLQSSDSYGVFLSWENDEHKLHSEVVDGTLRVWDDDGKMLSNVNVGTTAYIYFPYDAQFEEVNVKTALGDMEMDGFTAKTLTVTNDLGTAHLSNVTAGNTRLSLSLGDLQGYGLTVGGTATVESSLGDVDLDGSFHDLDITCDMGKVTVTTDEPKSAYAYDLNTSMGSVSLDGEKQSRGSAKGGSGDYTLKVDNSMGDVDIIFG